MRSLKLVSDFIVYFDAIYHIRIYNTYSSTLTGTIVDNCYYKFRQGWEQKPINRLS